MPLWHGYAELVGRHRYISWRAVQSDFDICGDFSITDVAAYPWVVLHERQKQDLTQLPALNHWFERIRDRAVTQTASELAKAINTAPTVNKKAKSVLFGQDAKTVR